LQLSLTPFIPGGWISRWLDYLKVTSPDMVRNETEICKIIGMTGLSMLGKVLIDRLYPLEAANMMIGLTGASGTAKSWIAERLVEDIIELDKGLGLKRIGHGTPEKIAELIEEQRWGIYFVDEVASAIKNAVRGGYMSEWGEVVLLPLYTRAAISLRRRKASRDIYVEPKSYYVNSIFCGTEKDYAGLLSSWPALKRRILMLKITYEPPEEYWEPSPEGGEVLAEIHLLNRWLKNKIVVVSLDKKTLNESMRDLKRKFPDPDIRKQVWHYVPKFIATWCLDYVMSDVADRILSGSELSSGVQGETEKHRGRERVEWCMTTPDDMHSEPYIHRLSILSEHLSSMISNIEIIKCRCSVDVLSELSRVFIDSLLTLHRRSREALRMAAAINPQLEDACMKILRKLEQLDGITTARNLLRVIDGLTAKLRDEALHNMSERGEVVLRRYGRSLLVILPFKRVCGTCALYDEGCPNMDSRAGIRPDPRDEPCELYRPVEV